MNQTTNETKENRDNIFAASAMENWQNFMSNWKNMMQPDGDASKNPFSVGLTGKWKEARQAGNSRLQLMRDAAEGNLETISTHQAKRNEELSTSAAAITSTLQSYDPQSLVQAYVDYWKDAQQRMVVTLDIMRKRGDNFIEHEAAECPPVLIFDYDIIVDGMDLPNPCNYRLLHIKPPEGIEVDMNKRPYIIIDPRAGHGAGIGGFKEDSQVGVALKASHPVYFVAFTRKPHPSQTIAHVCEAEASFVREVMRRHPEAEKPVLLGNCQGGWATLLIAATNPDLTGPLILSGAPVSTWEGTPGGNPMRYNAGVHGGTWMPMFMADMNNGTFDGSNLVLNFELLNPSRNFVGKFTDVLANPLKEEERFLNFERWWGGFYLLTEAEIRWIVEELFVGNKLARNEARLGTGNPVDLKNIEAPLIVFASWGDNITPPEQALNWILETYADETELKVLGRKIIYRVHETTGHLGIFVSAKIARKEHQEFASTVDLIEALPAGLYELDIETEMDENGQPRFTVDFLERTFKDLEKVCGSAEDRPAFAAVKRFSEMQANLYDVTMRPFVQAFANEPMAELNRKTSPMRVSRELWSSNNPVAKLVEQQAENARKAVANTKDMSSNPFYQSERFWTKACIDVLDLYKEYRDMMHEETFFSIWSGPLAVAFGADHAEYRKKTDSLTLRNSPVIKQAVEQIEKGGLKEAMVRMLLMISDAMEEISMDKLSAVTNYIRDNMPQILDETDPAELINTQNLIITYRSKPAIFSLPILLKTPEERKLAFDLLIYTTGPLSRYNAKAKRVLHQIAMVLEQEYPESDITENPLEAGKKPAKSAPKANGKAASKA